MVPLPNLRRGRTYENVFSSCILHVLVNTFYQFILFRIVLFVNNCQWNHITIYSNTFVCDHLYQEKWGLMWSNISIKGYFVNIIRSDN